MPNLKRTKTSSQPARIAAGKSAVRPKQDRQPKRGSGKASSRKASKVTGKAAGVAAAVRPMTPTGGERPQTKKGALTSLLQRLDGAAVNELMAATGWQAHSVRAALTGLRREGRTVVRSRDAHGITSYRITGGA